MTVYSLTYSELLKYRIPPATNWTPYSGFARFATSAERRLTTSVPAGTINDVGSTYVVRVTAAPTTGQSIAFVKYVDDEVLVSGTIDTGMDLNCTTVSLGISNSTGIAYEYYFYGDPGTILETERPQADCLCDWLEVEFDNGTVLRYEWDDADDLTPWTITGTGAADVGVDGAVRITEYNPASTWSRNALLSQEWADAPPPQGGGIATARERDGALWCVAASATGALSVWHSLDDTPHTPIAVTSPSAELKHKGVSIALGEAGEVLVGSTVDDAMIAYESNNFGETWEVIVAALTAGLAYGQVGYGLCLGEVFACGIDSNYDILFRYRPCASASVQEFTVCSADPNTSSACTQRPDSSFLVVVLTTAGAEYYEWRGAPSGFASV
jgi:hypothetical protein